MMASLYFVHLATFVSTDGKLSLYYDAASQTLSRVAEVELYSDAAKLQLLIKDSGILRLLNAF
jgi:hypothetical protein